MLSNEMVPSGQLIDCGSRPTRALSSASSRRSSIITVALTVADQGKLTVVNRQATVSMIPSSSSLVMKALNEPVRDRKKVKNVVHNGNITLDQVIDIARQMRERSMAKKLSGTVKEMLGTCNSIGCTVNGESPRDIQAGIDDGEVEIPDE